MAGGDDGLTGAGVEQPGDWFARERGPTEKRAGRGSEGGYVVELVRQDNR